MCISTGPSHLGSEPIKPNAEHWARQFRSDVDWKWPEGKKAAVTISFDVDADTAVLSMGDEQIPRMGSLSEGRFSVVRGLKRILDLYRRFGLTTTFFVPGWTAEHYPHVVEAILQDGHEIGHHGYVHTPPHMASPDVAREEMERGFAALAAAGAPRPRGYRSPSGEMTIENSRLVQEAGFLYDSSFMSDDRPYIEKIGEIDLLELPWHWSLDDWPYFGYSGDFGGNLYPGANWRQVMWDEYLTAVDEGGSVNIVCHPEIIGRGYRFRQLEKLLEDLVNDGRAWLPTMEELALHAESRLLDQELALNLTNQDTNLAR